MLIVPNRFASPLGKRQEHPIEQRWRAGDKGKRKMKRITRWIGSLTLTIAMALAFTVSLSAQDHDAFYRGARSRHPYNDDYDRRVHHDRDDQGGIGPGKGALIGGASGAVLGAVFGGGLKGALIGGGAGAGVGAVAGKVNQDNKKRDYRERYDRYGRPY
jgi:hypothetical protein